MPRPPALQRKPRTPILERLRISVDDAAEVSSLCRRTLTKSIATGELPATKMGRRTLIRPSDLEAWLDARSTKPEPKQATEESVA